MRNAGATYQRMMNKVYDKALLGDILEVYMDDMIVKSQQEVDHATHLKRVFEQTRKYNMRLNPEKCQAFTELPTPHSKKMCPTTQRYVDCPLKIRG